MATFSKHDTKKGTRWQAQVFLGRDADGKALRKSQ